MPPKKKNVPKSSDYIEEELSNLQAGNIRLK